MVTLGSFQDTDHHHQSAQWSPPPPAQWPRYVWSLRTRTWVAPRPGSPRRPGRWYPASTEHLSSTPPEGPICCRPRGSVLFGWKNGWKNGWQHLECWKKAGRTVKSVIWHQSIRKNRGGLMILIGRSHAVKLYSNNMTRQKASIFVGNICLIRTIKIIPMFVPISSHFFNFPWNPGKSSIVIQSIFWRLWENPIFFLLLQQTHKDC